MSTVGNVVFSFIMMTVSVVLIVESLQEIGSHTGKPGNETTDFHVPAIAAVTIAFFVKLCLFCYCWGLRNYAQVCIPLPSYGANIEIRFVYYGKIIGMICLLMDLGL
jgi:hypothetical protein